MKIIKDGVIVSFDKNKINNAIIQAMNQITYPNFEWIKTLTDEISDWVFAETNNGQDALEIDKLENYIMSVLYREMPDVARKYSSYKMKKEQAYTNPSEIEEVLFVSPKIEHENGNKNPHLVHIKNAYLAEIPSKQIMEQLLPADCLDAHKRSVVYFHDLSYSARDMINCTKGDAWIDVRKTDKNELPEKLCIEDFYKKFDSSDKEALVNLTDANYQILARDGWTKINRINRRKLRKDEPIYEIIPRNGLSLYLTGKHRLPILRNNVEMLLEVQDIKAGDCLMSFDENTLFKYNTLKDNFIDWQKINDSNVNIQVHNLSCVSDYMKYKYNITLNYYVKKVLKYPITGTIRILPLDIFLQILNKYPLPYEVLNKITVNSLGSKHKYPFLIPYSPQLAKIYGYIYSDGHIDKNEKYSFYHITFTNTNEDILNDYLTAFEEVFGRKLKKRYPTLRDTSPCIRIECGDKLLGKLLGNYVGGKYNGSGDLRIPDFIMYGNSNIKYSFLSASIDSDGTLSTQSISLLSACKQYCEQVVLLLQSLGYNPTMTLHDKKGSKYHFGNSNRTGIRNFDSYLVKINKNSEKKKLYEKMSTIKFIDTECYNSIGRYNCPQKIVRIERQYDDCFVYDIETESHWYNINNYFSHNCCLWNLEEMFNGCEINGIYIETPKSFRTACTVASQAISHATNEQYGGITINLLHLAKFVDVSRKKIRKELIEELQIWNKDLTTEEIEKIVESRLLKEIKDGMQTFLYQTNTLCAGTGQAAFLSVSCWLNENSEYTKDLILVFKELIRQRIKGIRQKDGTYINPNFPKILYFLDEDTMKGGKYYDITKMCAECSSKRLVPDYLSVKKHKELKVIPTAPMGKIYCPYKTA